MTVELQRPRHQYAVVVAVVVGVRRHRFVVVVVARARAPVGDAERERAVVGTLAEMSQCGVLPIRVALTELELIVRQERGHAVPLELDP